MPSPSGPLLNALPAIYHTSEELCQLLAVCEAMLFGTAGTSLLPEHRQQSLSDILPLVDRIATIASLFDAHATPQQFVPWLAQWVALSHLNGLTEQRQRALLAEIVPLYAQRGTKTYLQRLLEYFAPENATVAIEDQELQGFVVGSAKIGSDSRLEPERPFWFRVMIRASVSVSDAEAQQAFRSQWEKQLRRVIDLAKPAHTLYELDWQFTDSAEIMV